MKDDFDQKIGVNKLKTYKIDKYNMAEDYDFCFEHVDEEITAKMALKLCSEDNGRYTYRMETWEHDKMIGGWRFFQNGRELTSWVKDVFAKNGKEEDRGNSCMKG